MGYLGNAPADQAVQIGDGVVDTDQLAADAVTSAKIADGQVDTEHLAALAVETAKIGADAVTNAKVADGEIDTEHLAASAVTSAKVGFNYAASASEGGSATSIDSSTLVSVRNDVSSLALHSAVADNKAAYNLPCSFIDQFEDSTGIGTLTDSERNASEYVGAQQLTLIPHGTGTITGNMTWNAGISVAFDGTKGGAGYANGARKDPSTGSHLGKDWGSGNTKTVTAFKIWGVNNYRIFGDTASRYIKLQGSTDGFSSSNVTLYTISAGSMTNGTDSSTVPKHDVSSGITTSTAYRYHRIYAEGDGNGGSVSEIQFYEGGQSATATLISTAQTANAAQTKVSGVILYKNEEGTATLGTDLKIYFTCNGGTNWTESTPVAAGTFSSGILMAKCPEVTCTSGTDVRYKAVWANQSSKETQLHGIGINY